MESIATFKAEVFPNPAQDVLTVRFADASSYRVDLFDLTGRAVSSVSNARNSVVIPRGNLNSGVYLVRLISDNGSSEIVKIQFN
jgi:hypothetical protein